MSSNVSTIDKLIVSVAPSLGDDDNKRHGNGYICFRGEDTCWYLHLNQSSSNMTGTLVLEVTRLTLYNLFDKCQDYLAIYRGKFKIGDYENEENHATQRPRG